jgi:hypothetical protein
MATNITSKDYSLYKSWGLSFARNGAFPLDDSSIFLSLANAQEYASNNGAAYTGQIIAVVEEKEGVTSATAYLIKDAAGTLEALGAASGIEGLNTLLQTKVDKVDGKGLSTEDFTTAFKEKLEGVEAGAQVNQSAIGKVKVGDKVFVADEEVDTVEFAGANGVSVSADDATGVVTIENAGVRAVASGATNGTIKVNTNGTEAEVAVAGLGSAAFTESSAYAEAAHKEVVAGAEVLGHVYLEDAANEAHDVTSGYAVTPKALAEVKAIAESAKSTAEQISGSAFEYKGSVDSLEALQAIESPRTGDVYNVGGDALGANYVWNGSSWDNLGEMIVVDQTIVEGSVNPVSSAAVFTKNADQDAKIASAISKVELGEDLISFKWEKVDGTTGTVEFTVPEYDDVTADKSGLMTPALLAKVNGIAEGAEVNQNAIAKVKVGDKTFVAGEEQAVVEFVAGDNVSVSVDDATGVVTIASEYVDTTYTAGRGMALEGTEFSTSAILEVATGETNGTIKADGVEVAVAGLKSAAFVDSSTFATAAHTQASDTINSLTGYEKGEDATAIEVTDTLNQALAKLENKADAALPQAGGVITGDLEVQGTLTADASSAKKLSATDAGSSTQFVYFQNGVPVASTYTIEKSVPADAKFTDTTYVTGTESVEGLTKLYKSAGTAEDGAMTQKAVGEAIEAAKTALADGTVVAKKAEQDAAGNVITTTYATKGELANIGDSLADVATSGSYNDLIDTPESLKSPFAFKVNGADASELASYDGSAEVVLNLTAAQVGLGNVTNESKETMFADAALTGVPTAPTAAVETKTTQIATTEFVQAVVDSKIAAADAMIFKGTIGVDGTVTELPAEHTTGWTYKVIDSTITVGGVACEIGDMIVCLADGSVASDADWAVIQANIDGAVTGPVSSVANHIAIFDGATGKVVKDSGFTIETSVPAGALFTDENVTVEENAAVKFALVGAEAAGTGHLLTDSGVYVTANAGELQATTVIAENFTGLASKATADAEGNTISATYATKTEIANYVGSANVISGSGSAQTIASDSNNVTVITVDSAAFNLAFTPAAVDVYAEKFVHLNAGVNTEVTYSGAVFANNAVKPTWGTQGKNLFIKATFVAGRVILNVLDNDQITVASTSLAAMSLDNLAVSVTK